MPPPTTTTTTSAAPVSTATPTLNWSGYTLETKNITAIHAAWVVPPVIAPPATGYSATWIGIGGSETADLIQAGTEQDIENGETMYYAWVEALPDATVGVSPKRLPVHPGDLFAVTITNTSGNDWSVTIENRTTAQSLTLTTTYTSCKCSAEWIEELPEVEGEPDAALANFGTVTLTETTATVNGVTRGAAELGAQPVTLNVRRKVAAQPRVFGTDGKSFAVSYVP